MKLLRWAVGGASAYVIYKYSIGRKAKGEDVFVTAEKAVKQITGEPEPAGKPTAPTARQPSARKPASAKAPKAPQADASSGDAPAPEKPKRKRAPRKKPAGE